MKQASHWKSPGAPDSSRLRLGLPAPLLERRLFEVALPSVLLLVLAIFYFEIATHLGLGSHDGGPDEIARALLPQAISNGNLLPNGYDPEVTYKLGYYSYAFYPQVLPAYVSAVFMAAAKAFSLSPEAVFVWGRFASIVFSMVTLVSVSLTVREVVTAISRGDDTPLLFQCAVLVVLGFWPEYAFLSSYINNDIASLAGLALMLLSLVRGIRQGWNAGRTVLMSAGIVVSALSYLNVYPFILMTIVLFLISMRRQKRSSWLVVLAVVLCAVCTFPFFTVNYLRYGDPIGMKAFGERYQQWLADGGQVLMVPYDKGYASLIFETDWIHNTYWSFIGMFGYMTIRIPFAFCLFYSGVITLGVGAFCSSLGRIGNQAWHLVVVCALACLLTVLLAMYRSVSTDYQPQGRYVIQILLPMVIAMGSGCSLVFTTKQLKLMLAVFCVMYACITTLIFRHYALVFNWHGL